MVIKKNKSTIFWQLAILAFIGCVVWLFISQKTTSQLKNRYFKVTVELLNNCQVFDDAFVVKIEPTGQIAFFADKKTEINVRSDHSIRLAASPKFPDFVYDGDLTNVEPYVLLTADCDPPDRIRKTLDSLREQFKKK